MYILHIDTSGPVATVLLARDGALVSCRQSEGAREHAGSVNGLIDAVLDEGEIALQELSAIAVCNGPGSYTGLRIGLATAKGFCYALEMPLLLQSRLDLLLLEARQAYPEAMHYMAILPARTGEYFIATAYADTLYTSRHATTTEVLSILQEMPDAVLIGDTEDDIPGHYQKTLISHTSPDHRIWMEVAYEEFCAGYFADVAYAEPEYLKAAFTTVPKKL